MGLKNKAKVPRKSSVGGRETLAFAFALLAARRIITLLVVRFLPAAQFVDRYCIDSRERHARHLTTGIGRRLAYARCL